MAVRVSVIIPCRDAEPYLQQAIGSALDQHVPVHQIVVLDDGSTDGSLAIARTFEAQVPDRVSVVVSGLGRASRTRNLGAFVATGDALLFLDADDVLGPGAVGALSDALRAAPDGLAVCAWRRLELSEENRWIDRPPSCSPRLPGQHPLDAWLTGWYHPPCSVLWSRAAFERTGRWDEEAVVNDDGDLVMRALAGGVQLVSATGGCAYYRRDPRGTSLSAGGRSHDGLASRLRIIDKIAFRLEIAGRLPEHRSAVGAALARLAEDAAGEPAMAAEARALAARYGSTRHPPLKPAPASGTPAVRAAALEIEVRAGLDRAASLVERPAPTPSRPLRPTPRRPPVSVIVPTYNRAGLLARALRSVLGQTFDDFELLVVDDGSGDGTEAVARGFADPRVRYLRQPRNTGASAARNRGMREARGELLAFLDSDDEWLPEKLARQSALLREAPARVGLVYTGVETVRGDGTRVVQCGGARGTVYREMLWRNVIHGGGSNVMLRRGVLATAGFFHEQLGAIEDYEYWLRVSRWHDVDVAEEPLIRYHDPASSERRSLDREANLRARWWLYGAYGADMRRAGVAHLFLLKTARWVLTGPQPDARAARRLIARALVEAPASRVAVATSIDALVPAAGRMPWVRRHALIA